MICPAVVTVSGWPAGTSGQVKVVDPLVTVPPGATPTEASACAEKLYPEPSRFPAAGSASSLTPTVLYAAARVANATFTVAEPVPGGSLSEPALLVVAVRVTTPPG